jgi:hypothetical protein
VLGDSASDATTPSDADSVAVLVESGTHVDVSRDPADGVSIDTPRGGAGVAVTPTDGALGRHGMSESSGRTIVTWVGGTVLGCLVAITISAMLGVPSSVVRDPVTWILVGSFVVLSWIEARRRIRRNRLDASEHRG